MSLELIGEEMPVNILPQDMTPEEIIDAPDDIFEEAERFFMREVMDKINLIYLTQGIKILMNKYQPLTAQGAWAMLRKFQYHSKILLVANGYIITKSAYLDITNDRNFSRYCKGSEFKIAYLNDDEVNKARESKETLDCMWLICNMYYKIKNLMIGEADPWNITFTVPDDGNHPTRQFFLAKWNDGDETALSILLRSHMLSLFEADKEFWKDKATHDSIRILLLLDNKEQLKSVPLHCGVSAVYILNDRESGDYKILKRFKEDEAWGLDGEQ